MLAQERTTKKQSIRNHNNRVGGGATWRAGTQGSHPAAGSTNSVEAQPPETEELCKYQKQLK